MRIWLINDAENLPGDDNNPRLQRMGLLAYLMADNGNKVVWWQSTFNHYQKKMRYNTDKVVKLNDNLNMILIHSIGYQENVSVKRICHETIEAIKFYCMANRMKNKPDVIVVAMPTIIETHYAVKFAKKNNIPIVVDIRDLNPDVFTAPFDGIMKFFVSVGILPLKKMLSIDLKKANGIVGTTQPYLDWALAYAKRKQNENDAVFYVSYKDNGYKAKTQVKKWREYDFTGKTVCCFFGQFGKLVDFETVILCATKLKELNVDKYVFLLCGTGELLEEYKISAKELDNVVFPGWVNQEDITLIGSISDIGLMAYKPNDNFEKQMPNKFSEYLSLGLAIALQPTGVMKKLITDEKCGFSYTSADSLAQKLIGFINAPEQLAEMGIRARKLFEKSFSSDMEYYRYLKYVERIGKKR